LGIDFGLSRLIAQRSRKQYDVLILDELFRHLDQAGREAVVEMLQLLKKEKSSVIVVEHDSEMQGAFEHRVVVTKENGCSRIVEIDDAQSSGETKNYAV
jgi:DNA repair exonuclease SbcCD ATPase subunit